MSRPFILLGLVLAPLTAAAQEPETASRRVIYQAVTEIDIEALAIEATLQRPPLSLVAEQKRMGFPPMIKLRTDFAVEMSESVDQIR